MQPRFRTKLIAGAMLLSVGTASMSTMTGCEPVSAGAVVVVTVEMIFKLLAATAVSYVAWQTVDAIYVEIRDTVKGTSQTHRVELHPGDKLEVTSDGKLIRQ